MIHGKQCYLISNDVYDVSKTSKGVEISKDNKKMIIQGNIYNVPIHASEKLKLLSFDTKQPINSLCSFWNCYTNIASGNIFGNYKLVSSEEIKGLAICNNELCFK